MGLQSQEGKKVPNVKFKARENGEWVEYTSDQLFKGKKVVLFALPGAFTPTCSTTHLPRYEELSQVFKENGIDDIVCLSINDGFVMEAWAKDERVKNIRVIPDGNGEFSEGLGMLVDKADLGFGKRSWRYSMLVNDGVVEKMFIEPDKPGDPFEVSDADTMLRYLHAQAKLPDEVTIITKPGCQFCAKAKKLLDERGLAYEEIVLGSGISYKSLRNLSGRGTAPQIFINGKHVGGSDDLESYLKAL